MNIYQTLVHIDTDQINESESEGLICHIQAEAVHREAEVIPEGAAIHHPVILLTPEAAEADIPEEEAV